MTDLLDRIIAGTLDTFAVLHRPESDGSRLDVLTGVARPLESLAGLDQATDGERLLLIPYRSITERGFAAVDDGAPVVVFDVTEHEVVDLEDRQRMPYEPLPVSAADFDLSDTDYADTARQIIDSEIGFGVGANFVLKRCYRAQIGVPTIAQLLSVFRKLLETERGAYWTFLVRTPTRTWLGATPERHLRLSAGVATMNPISGTYRYPDTGPDLAGLLDFLTDDKETDELYMVVDEELKMMAAICSDRPRLSGPFVKEMSNLAHTEYHISGHTDRTPGELLRSTMFAPTVVGSPLESACRVVARYEPQGRGYYSGVIALLGQDSGDGAPLDSAILIRTAVLGPNGDLEIAAGATIVRSSSPEAEAAETRAKAAGLMAAFRAGPTGPAPQPAVTGLATHPMVSTALRGRNQRIGRFWLVDGAGRRPTDRRILPAPEILVIDAEDAFTAMLARQLESLGATVRLRRSDVPARAADYPLVVLGPGPGDPLDRRDPRIRALRSTVTWLLRNHRPFLAICLSHQVLSDVLGLPVVRKSVPQQGLQREIDYFGCRERVGFYNTFCAVSPTPQLITPAGRVEVAADPGTGEVHALRGVGFVGMQFHPESILTTDGPELLRRVVDHLLPTGNTAYHTDHLTRELL